MEENSNALSYEEIMQDTEMSTSSVVVYVSRDAIHYLDNIQSLLIFAVAGLFAIVGCMLAHNLWNKWRA